MVSVTGISKQLPLLAAVLLVVTTRASGFSRASQDLVPRANIESSDASSHAVYARDGDLYINHLLNRRNPTAAPVRPKQQKAAAHPKQKPTHRPKQQKTPARPNNKPAHRPKQQKPAHRPKQQKPARRPKQQKPAHRPKQQKPAHRPKQQKPARRPKQQKPAHRPKQQKPAHRPKQQKPTHRPKQQKPTHRPKQKSTGHPNTKAANRPKSANPIAKGAICRRGPGDKDGAKCEPTGGRSFKIHTDYEKYTGTPAPQQPAPQQPAPADDSQFKVKTAFGKLEEGKQPPPDPRDQVIRAQSRVVMEKHKDNKEQQKLDIVDEYAGKS
ncbi:unnamed protein product [Clonostachys rhizophaga]|uniref:Uncharacterized protein n=1 Tax=Clonostachys rhizophaga TaxID=160324 RepID=A0A9N9YND4_9HYPO|nr:unnamed protein product [Clonostachys rhizophaga]